MTKEYLVNELASRTGATKLGTERVLKHLTDIITEQVAAGNKVSVTGFGTFDLGKRAARRGVNPQTGEEIHIPEMKVPRFRAGKNLKAAIRG